MASRRSVRKEILERLENPFLSSEEFDELMRRLKELED